MHDDLDGVPLVGGNMDPVVRIGDTVRRTKGPWTESVHSLLGTYAEAGLTETPRALGIDARGREILTFLPGEPLSESAPEVLWAPSTLTAAAGLLRRLHDASAPLVGEPGIWRMEDHPPTEVICHNDFAPYNLIASDGRLVGVIDFDMASPGSRLWDLAYLAYRIVPLAEDARGFDDVRFGARDDRLRTLVDSYGLDASPDAVVDAAGRRLDALAAFTERRAEVTGRSDFVEHAAMYRRDAERLRSGNVTRPGM
ncbi:phosphotransferase [Microbacterium betulae]|uniref:Phosphotransferase n=1 Tax=Microbacterium betulae TaxID=2981139 RepID=A0AA97FKI4_9MICO|nr:phosphotransferase [Microbacterium sp. AB]WOF23769.1 phosphotransferase [Microbacterium sp. AB]